MCIRDSIPTVKEQIERLRAIKLSELTDFHHTFWGGSFSEIAVVGDFDSKEVQGVLEKSFGGWKSPRPFKRIAVPYLAGIGGSEDTINTPDKQMAVVAVAHSVEIRDDDPDFAALELINHVVGGGAKSRLIERLRQKEGLSYGAFSFINADSFDRNGVFAAGAICAPQNADKAMAALLDELGKVVKEGIPAAEITEAKRSYQLLFDNQLANDDFVASVLTEGLYVGRTMDYYRKLNGKIQGLTPPEVEKAIRKYIQLQRLVKIKAGDLTKKGS